MCATSFCPPTLASPQQLSPAQGRLASEPPQPGASSDSWARGCGAVSWGGGGGELTAICCSSHCDSVYFEAVCLCICGRGGSFFWIYLRDTAVLSASVFHSATCSQFEEKQPSVHKVPLVDIAPSLSRRLVGRRHLWRLGLFVCFSFTMPCQYSDLLFGEEADQLSHRAAFWLSR